MESVNWDDAQIFLDRLNDLPDIAALNAADGRRFQLPTEAQWEYAARGGRYAVVFAYDYAGSAHLPEVGWYKGNSQAETQPVDRKRPNALGLYDLSGNVWERCADAWQREYQAIRQDGSDQQGEGELAVRGGSWYFYEDLCRLSFRGKNGYAVDRYDYIGFRLARY